MNYWPRWINAITNATAHLTLAQMGAYDRLLDHAYKTEQALPGSIDACCRIVRAISKQDREAVASVLAEFWVLEAAGYTQQRVSSELAIAQPKIEAARANGKKSRGRPRKNPEPPENKPSGFSETTQDEPRPKAPHPQTSNPSDIEAGADAPAARRVSPAASVCLALREAGVWPVSPSNARLLALVEAGAVPGEFTQFAAKALEVAPSNAFGYVLGAVEGERKRAASGAAALHRGPMPRKSDQLMAGNIAAAREFLASTGE